MTEYEAHSEAARVAQLEQALRAHDRVWRALCWLVHDLTLTPDEAHEMLFRQSNDTNTRVADLAEAIIAEHERPEQPEQPEQPRPGCGAH